MFSSFILDVTVIIELKFGIYNSFIVFYKISSGKSKY